MRFQSRMLLSGIFSTSSASTWRPASDRSSTQPARRGETPAGDVIAEPNEIAYELTIDNATNRLDDAIKAVEADDSLGLTDEGDRRGRP